MGIARIVRIEPVSAAGAERSLIEHYRLEAGPLAVEVISAGCAIVRLEVPDRAGHKANVVLAHADVRDYLGTRTEYFGAVVGRVANRIASGRLRLRGRDIQLATNDGPHHLHGGRVGFDRRVWAVSSAEATGGDARMEFALLSADGDEGYPGELQVRVRYELDESGTLRLIHEAMSAASTIVNLTNHSYFNLGGDGAADVLDHELAIEADSVCEVDSELIPTGRLFDVRGTPFDFRAAGAIGPRLRSEQQQLQCAGGFDHCFALRPTPAPGKLRLAATLVHPGSGRRLRIETDQPGVQFYSGNFLDGSAVGPGGQRYQRHGGLCLETEAFPDAPNHPGFPSIELEPGQRYRTETVWRFDV